jgi:hypothetical protein
MKKLISRCLHSADSRKVERRRTVQRFYSISGSCIIDSASTDLRDGTGDITSPENPSLPQHADENPADKEYFT